MFVAGCSGALPRVRSGYLEKRIPGIPAGAKPVFSWSGSRSGLKTYWGDQDVSVQASAYFPKDWRNAGHGFWEVQAQNAKGKPIPFLGVIRRDVNEDGRKVTFLVPPIDLNKVPDGLYLIIAPNVQAEGGRITSIRPTGLLCEIRRHLFWPFRVKIPLLPAQASPLTPKPDVSPAQKRPPGTPIPMP